MDPLARFREVVFADTEFVIRPGERPDPVCVCASLLRSGRQILAWRDEIGPAPPYPIGDDVLFVAFAAAAELETHLALGWQLPVNVLDLRVEHIRQTNLSERTGTPRKKPPRKLIEVLRFYGIGDGDAATKEAMVKRIAQGWPFTAGERESILRYCLGDTTCLIPLLAKLLPGIGRLDQALRRGEYVAFTAEVGNRGIPFDPWAMGYLRRSEVRQGLRLRLVSDQDLTHGLYDGTSLTQARLAEFIVRHGLRWKRTATGKLAIRNKAFEALAANHPEFAGLAEIEKTLKLLHEFRLAAGEDWRCRTPIWAFSTITSRMAPSGSAYPFATAAWTRRLIMPAPGRALAYLDFSSMEFGVAAGLSRDPKMLHDYLHGDPYLGLGIRARFAPEGATAETHGVLRNRLKAPILAIQYGGGGGLMAQRLDVDRRRGQQLVELHKSRYAGYWAWSDRKLYNAFDDGVLIARDGWRCKVTSRTSEFTARNWLVQCNSAAIFRCAGLMARRLGIAVCAVVHDALLIEASEDAIETEARRATLCLERASRLYLHSLALRVDPKILRAGERFDPGPRGEKLWAYVERSLRELSTGEGREVA
jgi:hypothetical protein